MAYDPAAVARFFDAFGPGEYERHDASSEARLKYRLHVRCLRRHVTSGTRVLEIGPGPGRFTEVLAQMGCRISLVDISREQLRLSEARATELGYRDAIEGWTHADIVDLTPLSGDRFDAVLAFGGPFSYVLDSRHQALAECRRLLNGDGLLLLSVMSLWGTIHAFLDGVYNLPDSEIEAVTRTGDVTPSTSPSSVEGGHFFHMFTSSELRAFLQDGGFAVEHMAASNAVSTKWGDLLEDEEHFEAVLGLEERATQSPGALDMGTHILAVARRAAEPGDLTRRSGVAVE